MVKVKKKSKDGARVIAILNTSTGHFVLPCANDSDKIVVVTPSGRVHVKHTPFKEEVELRKAIPEMDFITNLDKARVSFKLPED